MSWQTAVEYDLKPNERAEQLIKNFGSLANDVQVLIIKKLENHGIKSDYENSVLKEILIK